MQPAPSPRLEPPRFETAGPMRLIGLNGTFSPATIKAVPDQWRRLRPLVADIAGRVTGDAYGVCLNFQADGGFDYFCGVEVAADCKPADGLTALDLAAHRYAVFHQPGHLSTIQATFSMIWTAWLPGSGQRVAKAPILERYGPEFDNTTGNGGFSIWLPVEE